MWNDAETRSMSYCQVVMNFGSFYLLSFIYFTLSLYLLTFTHYYPFTPLFNSVPIFLKFSSYYYFSHRFRHYLLARFSFHIFLLSFTLLFYFVLLFPGPITINFCWFWSLNFSSIRSIIKALKNVFSTNSNFKLLKLLIHKYI